jgi:hypothetical protein
MKKKGFVHIINRHYPNNLNVDKILDLPIIFKKAIELQEEGKSNKSLNVYQSNFLNDKYLLITNETKKNKLIVSTYRKD